MAHLKRNNYKELYRTECTTSPSVDAMMREVLHRLGNIDVEHEIQLDRLERSATSEELKSHIKQKIMSAHRERREPYIDLLTTLRHRRQRLSYGG